MQEINSLEKINAELEEKLAECSREIEELNGKLQIIQEQLVKSEKMASLGSLVAGVAHEINTPIGIGVTSVTFLEENINKINKLYHSGKFKKSDLEHFLKTGKEAVSSTLSNLFRAAELIKSFKQVAVDQTSDEIRKFSVRDYIEEILLSLKPQYKRTGHVVEVVGDDDIIIKNSPGALMQIITNLVVNSLIHGFEGIEKGHISIAVKAVKNNVEILYQDDGCGMGEDVLENIFKPFFTTKKGDGGSGLGLYIVYNLITVKMGGVIECESHLGKGVLFRMILPGIEVEHAAG